MSDETKPKITPFFEDVRDPPYNYRCHGPEGELLCYLIQDAIISAKKFDPEDPEIQELDKEWILTSMSEEPFSFIWTCNMLGCCWKTLRKRITEGWDRIDLPYPKRHVIRTIS